MSNNIDLEELLAQIRHRLNLLREKRGLSVYQLGLDSGVDNSVIFRIESGERTPTLTTLFKLVAALGVTPNEFFKPFDHPVMLGK